MAFDFNVTFLNNAGQVVATEEGDDLTNLQFGYKLNGGCASAQFELRGSLARRLRWQTYNPDAVEMLIGGMNWQTIWRGRLRGVTIDDTNQALLVVYDGYWANTKSQQLTATWSAATAPTLKTVIDYCIKPGVAPVNLCPLITYSASAITDPGVALANTGQADLVVDHQYPQVVWSNFLRAGDGGDQFHMAIWADKVLRVFRRNLALKWIVYSDMCSGGSAHTLSRANLFSHVTVAYQDALGATQWTTPVSDATAQAVIGEVKLAMIGNPFKTQALADAYAAQYLHDHKKVIDQGQGFTITSPFVYDYLGRETPSYFVMPGDVIRVVDSSFASTDPSGSADNLGSYYILETTVSTSGQVAVVLDNPNPNLAQGVAEGR